MAKLRGNVKGYMHILENNTGRVPLWLSGLGSSVVTTVAWVTAVAQVQSMAQEVPHASGAAKK